MPNTADRHRGGTPVESGKNAKKPQADFLIIDLYATRGEQVSYRENFKAIPAGVDVAFLIIQQPSQADPHQETTLAQLAQRMAMPVVDVDEPMPLEAGHIYTLPPHAYLLLNGAAAQDATLIPDKKLAKVSDQVAPCFDETAGQVQTELQRLTTVVQDSNDAITTQSFDNKILSWNRGAEHMYGWREHEALGMDIRIIVPAAKDAELRELVAKLARGETVAPFETQRATKDGKILDVYLTATPLTDQQGRPTVIVTTERDITGHKRVERALRQAKEKAEAANAQKSRFLAAASHDLRQPLLALNVLNDILTKKVTASELIDIVNEQSEALRTIWGLLDALLDMSKLEIGVVLPKISTFPVVELFNRMRNEFALQAQKKGLVLRIVPCTLLIRSDVALLSRILENFIANAIKHTDSGKVLLGCRRYGSDTLRIEVWDSGIGIPQDQLKSIFAEFYQFDRPLHHRRGGLGLGLAIVDGLARLLGHKLDVRSIPGKGSMFAIYVPMASGCS